LNQLFRRKLQFMTRKFRLITWLITTTVFSTLAQRITTVDSVNLLRYEGLWYEIASFPQKFQKGCCGTTAKYTLSEKGYVIVENSCYRDSLNGNLSYIKGKAFVDKGSKNAKLKVQFFKPFKGKYWILDLDTAYRYAAVGHPNRKYLWVLSRTPQLDSETYEKILSRLREKGFDTFKLKKTLQP
jgi:apolipoprotein D and lipocalin family protein